MALTRSSNARRNAAGLSTGLRAEVRYLGGSMRDRPIEIFVRRKSSAVSHSTCQPIRRHPGVASSDRIGLSRFGIDL